MSMRRDQGQDGFQHSGREMRACHPQKLSVGYTRLLWRIHGRGPSPAAKVLDMKIKDAEAIKKSLRR